MRRISGIILFCFLVVMGFAQDPHLSMFYNAPMQLNPALTGVVNGNYRFTGLYRSQWGEVLRDESVSQFRTVAGGMDFRIPINKNAIGIGLGFLNDKAGESQFATNRAGLSLSYLQNLDRWGTHYLVVGLQADVIQRSFSLSGLRFGNQWNGISYDPSIVQDNPIYLATLNDNYIFLDASLGLLYFMRARNERTSFYAGFSALHVNQPNQSLSDFGEAKLPIRYAIHSGVNFPIATSFDLLPKFLFQFQGQNMETVFGADIRYIFDEWNNVNNAFKFGVLYRGVGGLNSENNEGFGSESIILTTGFDYEGLQVGVAYDINISQFQPGTLSRGGFEVSLAYVGAFKNRYRDVTPCPEF